MMSLFKYLDRIKRIDVLVRKKATGNPEEFAEKLGISKSMLMLNLSELKKLDVPIEYSALHRSYIYTTDYVLSIDKLLSIKEYASTKGGTASNVDFYNIMSKERYKLSQNFFFIPMPLE